MLPQIRAEIKFAWQKGYGAFSVSSSKINAVIKYINNQEAHHRKFTFEQEFITLLKKHGIPFDPNHIFGSCRRLPTPTRAKKGARWGPRLRGSVFSSTFTHRLTTPACAKAAQAGDPGTQVG
jgi:hypothetical protein